MKTRLRPTHVMVGKEQAYQAELTATRFIAQRETGPWAEQDAENLQQWLSEATIHRVAYYRLHAAWHEVGRLNASCITPYSTAVTTREPVLGEARSRSQPFRRMGLSTRAVGTLAAGILLTLGATLFAFRGDIFHRTSYRTVVGGLEAVPLADGSRVTLNTDSALRISVTKEERDVDLQRGEAFFQVAKDKMRPFVVKAGNQRIVAVGTQFSVRRDHDDVLVSVTEGAVRLETTSHQSERAAEKGDAGLPVVQFETSNSSPKSVLVLAGTTARSNGGAVIVQKAPVTEIEERLSWRSGTLTFHDTSLAEAAAEFNRYNTRKIVIGDASVGAMRVGGIFGATTLDPFIHLLESGFPVRVTQQGDEIIFSAR